MTKTVSITGEGNETEWRRLADGADKRRGQEEHKLGGARVPGFRRRQRRHIFHTQKWNKDVDEAMSSKHESNLGIWADRHGSGISCCGCLGKDS